MAIGGPQSNLAPDRPVAAAKLLRLPLILQSHHLGIRATINHAAAKARIVLKPQVEAYSSRLIMDLVENGDGYAILPAFLCAERCAAGRLKRAPIVSPALDFKVYLSAKRHDRTENQKVMDAALTTLRALFAELDFAA
jgi:LysR family nitrogen assimilation transcriptional regulator